MSGSDDLGLSPRSQAIYNAETKGPRGRTRSPGRTALVLEFCRALDNVDTVRGRLALEGFTVTTKKSGVPHVNPLVHLLAAERAAVVKLGRLLNLNWTMDVDGRE